MSNLPTISLEAQAIHTSHKYGVFTIYIFLDDQKKEVPVLVKGDVSGQEDVLCRVASECLTGMVFNSAECECAEQLELALQKIHEADQGILVFLRQEGRGQGLVNKVRALANKNKGIDTFKAVELLGKKPDIRTYEVAAAVLKYFEVGSVRLMTNNPQKLKELEEAGVKVSERVPDEIKSTDLTQVHLKEKQRRGHLISEDFDH